MNNSPIYDSVVKDLNVDPVSLQAGHNVRMTRILNGTPSKILQEENK